MPCGGFRFRAIVIEKKPTAIIVDDETGEPIEGAVVLAQRIKHSITKRAWWEGGTTYTARAEEVFSDEQGRIVIPWYWSRNPFAGKRNLLVYKPGYALWDSDTTIFKKPRDQSEFTRSKRVIRMLKFEGPLFKKLGEKFIKDFNRKRPVVGPSASCIGYVRKSFDELFYNSAFHNEYKQLQQNIFEISDFLVNVLQVTEFGSVFEEKVTYHDSCAALREYGLKEEPRILLRKVKGLELIEMEDTDVCCGFGGTFSIKFEPISAAMAEQKVLNALETGASYIVSSDSSCLLHQKGYIEKHQLPIKTAHLVDVLASGL